MSHRLPNAVYTRPRPRKHALVIVRYADNRGLSGLGDAQPSFGDPMFSPAAITNLDAAEMQRLSTYSYGREDAIYQQAFANWKLNEDQRKAIGLPSAPMPVPPSPADYQYNNPEVNYYAANPGFQLQYQVNDSFPARDAAPVAPTALPPVQYIAPDFSPGAAPIWQQEERAQAAFDQQSAARQATIDADNARAQADIDAAASLRAQIQATIDKSKADAAQAAATSAAQQQVAAQQAQRAQANAGQAAQAQAAAARAQQAASDRQAAAAQQQVAAQQAQRAQAAAVTSASTPTYTPTYTPSSARPSNTAPAIIPITLPSATSPTSRGTIDNGAIFSTLTQGGGIFSKPLSQVLPAAATAALPATLTAAPIYFYLAAAAAAYLYTRKKHR